MASVEESNAKTEKELLHLAEQYGNEYGDKYDSYEMEQIYIKLINMGNVEAMIKLADSYCKGYFKDEHIQAQKYYKMAIKKGSVEAMRKLGYFHHYIDEYSEDNPYKIKLFYSMAIRHGDIEAMCLMAEYYAGNYIPNYEPNEGKMEKYYLMAHNKGDKDALKSLILHYQNKANSYLRNMDKYGDDYKKCISKINQLNQIVPVVA